MKPRALKACGFFYMPETLASMKLGDEWKMKSVDIRGFLCYIFSQFTRLFSNQLTGGRHGSQNH